MWFEVKGHLGKVICGCRSRDRTRRTIMKVTVVMSDTQGDFRKMGKDCDRRDCEVKKPVFWVGPVTLVGSLSPV